MTKGEGPAAQNAALPLTRRITYRLSRTHSKLNAWATKILRERAELTLMQWRVLVLLDTLGDCTIAEMVRKTGFDKGLVSRTVKTLSHRGAVEMTPSSEDQRRQIITMTKHGRAIFDQAAQAMMARQEALVAGFTPQELEMLFAALDQLEAVAEAYGGPET